MLRPRRPRPLVSNYRFKGDGTVRVETFDAAIKTIRQFDSRALAGIRLDWPGSEEGCIAKKPRRISEEDLMPALRILAARPNGTMSTTGLIEGLIVAMRPEGEDADILEGRQDTRFSQIVRNIVSHKKTPGNLIAEGLVEHLGRRGGLKITEAGRLFLAHRGG
jgi:hypothetical protein